MNMAPVSKPKPQLSRTFLREWRDHCGINQQDAADAINVSRGLLSKIENAHSPYLQQHLEGLAALYECSPADILARDPKDTESLTALLYAASQASKHEQSQILSYIRFTLKLD